MTSGITGFDSCLVDGCDFITNFNELNFYFILSLRKLISLWRQLVWLFKTLMTWEESDSL